MTCARSTSGTSYVDLNLVVASYTFFPLKQICSCILGSPRQLIYDEIHISIFSFCDVLENQQCHVLVVCASTKIDWCIHQHEPGPVIDKFQAFPAIGSVLRNSTRRTNSAADDPEKISYKMGRRSVFGGAAQ